MSNIISVTSLVTYLKKTVENDINLKNVYVKGEISRVIYQASGHVYFSLKDDKASISCTLWKTYANKLPFKLEDGMKVVVLGSPSIYVVRGDLQFNAIDVKSDGSGDLYLALEQLKKKLEAEHLFDNNHKLSLPEYPMSIGIISGKSAAGLKDVLSIIQRRWPICNVQIYPTLVQGIKASKDIIEALKKADNDHHDALLLVRGGGSIEDLWCFNDEELVRYIYNMKTCLISGIGHEIDYTLVDYVSDIRAATPSAAAELITPDIEDVKANIQFFYKTMNTNIVRLLNNQKNILDNYKKLEVFNNPNYLLKDYQMKLTLDIHNLLNQNHIIKKYRLDLNRKKQTLINNSKELINVDRMLISNKSNLLKNNNDLFVKNKRNELNKNIALLDATSPLKVLGRGYSILYHNNEIIKDADKLKNDDLIMVKMHKGNIKAKVIGE